MNKSIEDIYKGYLKKEFTPTEILNQYLDRINKVDKSLNSFTEIFETPPRFIQWLKSLNKSKSPTGTKGAPCPPKLTSCTLKSQTTGILVDLFNSTLFPIW